MSLNKKVILITGSTSGLGQDLCEKFSKLNTFLICIGRNKKKISLLKKKIGTKSATFFCRDLNFEKNINKIVRQISKKSLMPDIMIHCMGGGLGLTNPLINFKQWSLLFNTNFLSGVHLNNQILKFKKKNHKINILHIAGIASLFSGMGSVGLSTTKFMLIPYVNNMSRFSKKFNFIINCLLPGGFMSSGGSFFRLKKKNFKAYKNYINNKTRRKRLMTFEDLYSTIIDIVSNKNKNLNGCNIVVDKSKSITSYNTDN